MRIIDADVLVAQWEVDAEQTEDVIAKMFIYGAIHDVKHEPTIETEPQWIPFSEKMPDEHEWIGTKRFGTTISDTILITFDVDGERFVKPMNLQNGKLSLYDTATMDAIYEEWKMVAWMEMPKPWKGDK